MVFDALALLTLSTFIITSKMCILKRWVPVIVGLLWYPLAQGSLPSSEQAKYAGYTRRLERIQDNLHEQSIFATLVDLQQLLTRQEKDWNAQRFLPITSTVQHEQEAFKMNHFDAPILEKILIPILHRLERQLLARDLSESRCFNDGAFAKFRSLLTLSMQRNALHCPTIVEKYQSLHSHWIAQELPLCMNVILQSVEEFSTPTSFAHDEDMLAYTQQMFDNYIKDWRHIHTLKFPEKQEMFTALKLKWHNLFQHRLVEPLLHLLVHPFQSNTELNRSKLVAWYEHPTQSLHAIDMLGAMLQMTKKNKSWHSWRIGLNKYIRLAHEWFCQAWIRNYSSQARPTTSDWVRLQNFHDLFQKSVHHRTRYVRHINVVQAAVLRCHDAIRSAGLKHYLSTRISWERNNQRVIMGARGVVWINQLPHDSYHL